MDKTEMARSVSLIARQAGEAIMKIYGQTDFQVELKADESPLTIADKTANEIICSGLKELAPNVPIISEENKTIPYAERRNFGVHWLVDPLDGTKEFIKRNGEFTVNIALIQAGKPILGVVYAPCLDEMYWAVKNEGAWLEKAGNRQRLQAASFTMQDQGLKVVCSRSHLNEGTQAFIDQLNAPERVSQGSSLKFLILAKGEAHLYPRLAPTMEWDTGAAHIVLEEAGGQVINEETKLPLSYNKENLLNPHFVAYGRVEDLSA
ncbi:MAG: 3'(2'),5'-bisphosphate nucleotidase CysQ [Saprospiraceae bacterium]|nr:MAG: 3'(2'),5'-bisphosphate nucleotidase CysQ [Saprospiraceae bacterium]